MTLKPFTFCEYAADGPSDDSRMSAGEFTARLPKVEFPLHWFADYTGANIRTVKRWSDGSLDIPPWVNRMLWLHEALSSTIDWIEEFCPPDAVLQAATREALWTKDDAMLAARAAQRQARRVVHHINGDIRDNRPENIAVVALRAHR